MMADSAIEISIVIPVKNGEPWLKETLEAIFKQSLISKTEVIIIDSGSTDATFSILSGFPVRLLTIKPEEFNHGATRNFGVQAAKGKYVVMTVQDARPVSEKWLESLLDGFDSDEVAGVCGQQIVPHDIDKNPVEWFRPVSIPKKQKFHFSRAEDFAMLSDLEKKRICSWDDVNAMYKRDVLLRIPFQHVSFAEDALWAKDAILSGYSIVHNPFAQVAHYHHETPDYTLKRCFTVYYHFYKFFNIKPDLPKTPLRIFISHLKLLLFERISLSEKWKWIVYNVKQQRAMTKAVKLFHSAIKAGGENELDITHSIVCKMVPQISKP